MDYPQSFINECKEVYPDYARLHELLESGNVFAGRYLDDSSSSSISIREILNSNSLEELKEKAKLMQRRVDVYSKWCVLHREAINGD